MTINQRIIEAVKPVCPICRPEVYLPNDRDAPQEIYCTFDVDQTADAGDNEAGDILYSCLLHFFAPYEDGAGNYVNTLAKRHALADALSKADDFSLPVIVDESDGIGQHFTFAFQAV